MKAAATIRTGLTSDQLKEAFADNLRSALGRSERVATLHDLYFALALTVRDRVFQRGDRIGDGGRVGTIRFGEVGTRLVSMDPLAFLTSRS